MYLSNNDATTFNIHPGHDDHTKFKVPGPPVYTGSDSVAGDPSVPPTDDIIPCNCEDGPDSTSPPVVPAAPAAPVTLSADDGTDKADKLASHTPPPAVSVGDCAAAFVCCFPARSLPIC